MRQQSARAAAPRAVDGALTGRSRITCHHCQRPGHIRPNCPDRQQRFSTNEDSDSSGHGHPAQPSATGPPPSRVQTIGTTLYLSVQIGKRKHEGLLDTGSEVTLLPAAFAGGCSLLPSYRTLRAANGTVINVLGSVTLNVKIGRLVLLTEFIVSDQVDEILFGMDWLKKHRCVLECGSNTLRIQDSFFELFKKVPKECRHRIVSRIDVQNPARTEALISGKAVCSNLSKPNADLWSTSPSECVQGLHAARGLVRLRSGWDIHVRVVNLNNVPVVVKKDTHLSSMSEVLPVAGGSAESVDGADLVRAGLVRQHVTDISSKVHPEVSHSQRLHLEHLLFQYSDILSCSEMDLGHTDLVQHSIDTGDEKPVRQQLRKTPLAHGQIIDDYVENLLRHGLIQPAREDWASNIVLTAKKDRSWRFCIDYRQSNSETKRDLFPLPRIDACLDALSQAVWFSTLDFRSGYYQVGLNSEDARKTTFISRKGAWS